MRQPDVLLVAANVHLLANPPDASASLSRQREVAALLGQLQQVETQYLKKKPRHVVPLLVGVWNANEGDESEFTADGWFAGQALIGGRTCRGFFRDACLDVASHGDGFTFDPRTNHRARQTRSESDHNDIPKRNDRIYLAADPPQQNILKPQHGQILGTTDVVSDHFGITLDLAVMTPTSSNSSCRVLNDPTRLHHNAWAVSAQCTMDTLLGLVLPCRRLGQTELLDPASSLPVPHITLLHEVRGTLVTTGSATGRGNVSEGRCVVLEGK